MQEILDDLFTAEDNGLPPPNENEEYMAENRQVADLSRQIIESAKETKADFKEVQGNFRTINNEIGRLRVDIHTVSTNVTWIIRIGSTVIVAVALALVYFNITLGHLAERISALEGKGGSYSATEQSLLTTKSPERADADLNLLQAQIQKRAISSEPLNPVELAKIGVTVNEVANRYPNLPSVWNASSQLVNLRFGRTVPTNLPNCWSFYKGHTVDRDVPKNPLPSNAHIIDEQHFGHCELALDDGPGFRNSGFGQIYEKNLRDYPAAKLLLTVHDAVITYSGGKMIPFDRLVCVNCVFRANVKQTPLPDGQRVMRRLLTADTSNVQFSGPQSGE